MNRLMAQAAAPASDRESENQVNWLRETKRVLEEKLADAGARAQQAAEKIADLEIRMEAAAPDSQSELRERWREAQMRANQLETQLHRALQEGEELQRRAQHSEREIERLAFQDSLTGLPNEHLMEQHLERILKTPVGVTLLRLDLDRFKVINDALGFKAGDELLVRVSERLQRALAGVGDVARRGEDEFLVVLTDPGGQTPDRMAELCEVAARRVGEELAAPFTVQGQKLFVAASIGMSCRPGDAETAQDMLANADSALHRAKAEGRNRSMLFTPAMRQSQKRSLALDLHLRHALEAGELYLEYQPIVELETDEKGIQARLVGAEALLRWNHRVEGLLTPGEFLPAAEESGQIVVIGRWIARAVCRQLKAWHDAGLQLFGTINLSARQLLTADLAEDLLRAAEEAGVHPGWLTLDVSEDFGSHNAEMVDRTLERLRQAGFRIAIDNYGAGYSSLARLAGAQMLKIAPRLTQSCLEGNLEASVCAAALHTAVGLGVIPLAVGVENPEQLRHLVAMGARMAQGYLFSASVSPAQLTELGDHAWQI
ncbi:MAG: EAL domain-containing protein [Armatimonadetes bacterium]|nr:EAL domain-containing protein [Armatimonadota bacterium]